MLLLLGAIKIWTRVVVAAGTVPPKTRKQVEELLPLWSSFCLDPCPSYMDSRIPDASSLVSIGFTDPVGSSRL